MKKTFFISEANERDYLELVQSALELSAAVRAVRLAIAANPDLLARSCTSVIFRGTARLSAFARASIERAAREKKLSQEKSAKKRQIKK